MNKFILRCIAAMGFLCSSSVFAMPILVGSDYNVTVLGAGPQQTFTNVVFDGVSQGGFSYNGLDVTIDESQQDLGGGQFGVVIDVFIAGVFFPDPGNGFANIGFGGNPLDLVADYRLDSAILRMFDAAGAQLAAADFIGSIVNPDPWNGTFTDFSTAGGFINIGQRGVEHIQFDFTMTQVPLPPTIALFCLGLIGLSFSRRKNA